MIETIPIPGIEDFDKVHFNQFGSNEFGTRKSSSLKNLSPDK